MSCNNSNQNNQPKTIEEVEFYKKDQTISDSFLPRLNNVSINQHTLDRLEKKFIKVVISARTDYVNDKTTSSEYAGKLVKAIDEYTENIINELGLKTNVYVQGVNSMFKSGLEFLDTLTEEERNNLLDKNLLKEIKNYGE